MTTRRTFLVWPAAALLSGCGLRPLYGTRASGEPDVDLSSVAVDEQTNRPGQLVRNELLRVMNTGESRYRLALTVKERERFVSSLPRTQTSRFEITLTGSYTLNDSQGGKAATKGSSFATASFDRVRQPVADLQALDNARERAAIELAGDIRLRIAVYLSQT
jgi:LPS-assembly lipoprotein